MKKLFGNKNAREDKGSLINKTVQVGQYHVRVDALLGSGGYADIYRVMEISSGHKFALKHLRLNGDQEIIREVQQEAKTQAKLRGHPNILRLHAVAFAGPKGGETDGFFLLEYCPGTLLDLLARHNFALEERTIIHIFNCVCQAIAHMHRQKPPMAHRDLKAENVLMLPDGTWILCDYGSATSRAEVYETAEAMAAEEEVIRKHTTPAYRPPEMWDLYQRQLIDTKVDIWALGVLLFVLCYGRLPFTGDSKLQILNGKFEMPSTRPPQLRALIRQMLTVDPAQRPEIKSVLEQLDQAARAITGRGITAAAAAEGGGGTGGGRSAAAAAASAAVQPPPVQQQQQLQQNVQQFLQQQQQQPGPAAASSNGISWSTNEAHATAGNSGNARSAQQQQQVVPQDWARFSSGGASPTPSPPAAAAAAAVVPDVTQKRAPPPPPLAAAAATTAAIGPAPHPAAAAVGLRAHALSTPEGSPLRGTVAGPNNSTSSPRFGTAAAAAAAAAGAAGSSNGYPSVHYPTIPQAGTSSSSSSTAQQSGPDLGKLADITARAAAAAASSKGQATRQPQQQHQQIGHQVQTVATEPLVILERQSRPYSSGGSSSSSRTAAAAAVAPAAAAVKGHSSSPGGTGGSGIAPSTPIAAAAAAAEKADGDSRFKQLAAGVHPASSSSRPQQQQRHASSLSTASAPAGSMTAGVAKAAAATAAAGVTAPAAAGSSGSTQQSSAASAASTLAAASAAAVGADTASLSYLRTAVFDEMDLLRAQVQSLSDENKAFLFRIKQLEQYTQQQAEAMARMQQQMDALQQQQQQQRQQLRQQLVPGDGTGQVAQQQQQQRQEVLRGWLGRPSGVGGSGAAVADVAGQQQQQPGTAGPAAGTFLSTQNALL